MNEQNDQKKQVAVGILIAVGLTILLIGIFAIGGQRKAFVKSITVKAIFDDVKGLQPGNNIWLSGMKIGTVQKVTFYGSAQVEVIMHVEKEAQPHIRKDAMAKVSTDGLVGNKIIVIYGGTESSPPIANDEVLRTEHQGGPEEMMATLQANNTNLLEITGNLKTISRKLASGEGTIGQLINDPALGNSLQASMNNLRAASAGSEKLIANLRSYTDGLRKPGVLANDLVTDTVIFQRLRQTVTRLNDAAATATAFTEQMRTVGQGLNERLNDPNTPAGVLLHNEEAAADLQRTIKNLRVSSQELSEDLEAVQHSWLLRGFFRKRNK